MCYFVSKSYGSYSLICQYGKWEFIDFPMVNYPCIAGKDKSQRFYFYILAKKISYLTDVLLRSELVKLSSCIKVEKHSYLREDQLFQELIWVCVHLHQRWLNYLSGVLSYQDSGHVKGEFHLIDLKHRWNNWVFKAPP